MDFLKRLFRGGKTHSPPKQTQAQRETAPTPCPPPAPDEDEGDGVAEALVAELSRIERNGAELLTSAAALAQAGLARLYEEVDGPQGTFVLGYMDGCANAVAKAASAAPLG